MTDAEIDGLALATRGNEDPPPRSESVPAAQPPSLASEPDPATGAELGLGSGAGGGGAFGEEGAEVGTIISGGEALPVTEEGLPDDDRGVGSA